MHSSLLVAAAASLISILGTGAALACPPGFSTLQGSDTCVRVSGRVRAETVIGSPKTRSSDGVRTGASGRVQLDVRKQTEYGPLRAVIRAEGVR
ncbi:porin [Microvirga puerhi]|uniref:Porin n=1 Tax=Microvirga puerhi TaxID=2876078 RepID=A0ABS7VH29_9HYPH|nr:porin [Microvirga puerhi]MBZ6074810.1 porin [Microvirga puerhi]